MIIAISYIDRMKVINRFINYEVISSYNWIKKVKKTPWHLVNIEAMEFFYIFL